MAKKSGQCMCGAVKFTAHDVGAEFGSCQCKMCQRWSGSSLLAFTAAEGTVDFEGTENISTIQSSDWAERAWCNKCGSGLWYRVTNPGEYCGMRYIPIGLLDDSNDMALVREIFVDTKSAAFSYAGDLKKMTGAEVMAQFAPSGEET